MIQCNMIEHVEIDRHFIKDHLQSDFICIPFIQTKHQLADVFTKGLNGTQFSYLVDKLGMLDIY